MSDSRSPLRPTFDTGREYTNADLEHLLVEDDHLTHWFRDPITGERRAEASVVVDGVRTWWCGHTEPE